VERVLEINPFLVYDVIKQIGFAARGKYVCKVSCCIFSN